MTEASVDVLVFLLEEPKPLSAIRTLFHELQSWQFENTLGELFWAEPQLARDDDEFVLDSKGKPEKQWRLKDPGWAKRVIRSYRNDFYLSADIVPRLCPSALSL